MVQKKVIKNNKYLIGTAGQEQQKGWELPQDIDHKTYHKTLAQDIEKLA